MTPLRLLTSDRSRESCYGKKGSELEHCAEDEGTVIHWVEDLHASYSFYTAFICDGQETLRQTESPEEASIRKAGVQPKLPGKSGEAGVFGGLLRLGDNQTHAQHVGSEALRMMMLLG